MARGHDFYKNKSISNVVYRNKTGVQAMEDRLACARGVSVIDALNADKHRLWNKSSSAASFADKQNEIEKKRMRQGNPTIFAGEKRKGKTNMLADVYTRTRKKKTARGCDKRKVRPFSRAFFSGCAPMGISY